MTTMMSKCMQCKHIKPFRKEDNYIYCDAFPRGTGIPDEVFFTEIDHIKPYPGDHGILFEPADEFKNDYDSNGQLKD